MDAIFEGSEQLIKKTSEYISKVEKIKYDTTSDYNVLIERKKFYLPKLYLRLKCKLEINNQIKKLTPLKSLY